MLFTYFFLVISRDLIRFWKYWFQKTLHSRANCRFDPNFFVVMRHLLVCPISSYCGFYFFLFAVLYKLVGGSHVYESIVVDELRQSLDKVHFFWRCVTSIQVKGVTLIAHNDFKKAVVVDVFSLYSLEWLRWNSRKCYWENFCIFIV